MRPLRLLQLCLLSVLSACSSWQGEPGDGLDTLNQRPQIPTATPCKVENPAWDGVDDGKRCAPAFASGVNVAWLRFAGDLPAPDLCEFQTVLTNSVAAGGPVIRWWLHTNGSVTPGYDEEGNAKPITLSTIDDVLSVLDLAQASKAMLVISLWSFDMLRTGPVDNNALLLSDDAHRQKYIDNVLIPLVTAVKGHPALYAWEAFNEAEGMSIEFGWVKRKIPMTDIQRSVSWFGSAIHSVDPQARFTTGCWSFPACSSAPGFKNYYSDDELRRVGERDNGTLDFYEVHYYSQNRAAASPFVHPAEYWQLDKPIVIGEFWATDSDGVLRDDLFTRLYDTGYAGAWAWQYKNKDGANDFRWPSMQKGLENLRAAQPQSSEVICQ